MVPAQFLEIVGLCIYARILCFLPPPFFFNSTILAHFLLFHGPSTLNGSVLNTKNVLRTWVSSCTDKPKLNIYSTWLIIFLPQLASFPVFLTQFWNTESSPLPSDAPLSSLSASAPPSPSKSLSTPPSRLPFHRRCPSAGRVHGFIKDFPFSVSFVYFILQDVAELFL